MAHQMSPPPPPAHSPPSQAPVQTQGQAQGHAHGQIQGQVHIQGQSQMQGQGQLPIQRPYSPYQAGAPSPYQTTPYQHTPSPVPSPGPSPVPGSAPPLGRGAGPGGIAFPPAKRPRLSPNPTSPHTAPYHAHDQTHPHQAYSPVAVGSAASPPSFNAPQPYASSPSVATGSMGPPPRPTAEKAEKEEKDKIHDISDVTDVFHGSGIDLREEENYMTSTFRNRHGHLSQNASFASTSSLTSPEDSFGQLSQSFHNHPAFSGSNNLPPPIDSQPSIEKQADRKHWLAAHELAEKHEKHLNDPFLLPNVVRHKMHSLAYQQGVHLNVQGLYDKIPAPQTNGTTSSDAKPHALLDEGVAFADVLALISLAASDRVRTLIDDAYTVARARRYGSHGVVPLELTDIAIADTPSKRVSTTPQPVTDSEWERPPKRDSEGGIKTEAQDEDSKDSKPVTATSFSSAVTDHLMKLAIRDRDAERERVRKRQERAKRATSGNAMETTPTTGSDGVQATAGTPSAAATPAPDASAQVAPEKPLTKKERERQAKLGQTEEVLHKNANSTAAMQLGIGKKKKYSWMTGPGPAAASNPYKPSAKASSTASAAPNGSASGKGGSGADPEKVVDRALQVRERMWGGWREDGIEGRGIQIRDWVTVLERDGREKRALQKCYLKLDSEGQ